MSSMSQPTGHELNDRKGPRQTYYPYEQQDSTVERKPVYRDPGVSQERRTVEICEPRRERRESSSREHRRSSRSANPPPREMVLSQKGTFRCRRYHPRSSDSFQVAVGATLLNPTAKPTTKPIAQARGESATVDIMTDAFP